MSRIRETLIILILLLIGVFLIDLMIGSVVIPVSEILKVLTGNEHAKKIWETIILDIRLPKAFTAILIGIALAVSGFQIQTLFRNPLAGPDVLGISSGSGLLVAIVILCANAFGIADLVKDYGHWSIVFASWIGAALTLILIFIVSMRINSITVILILGLMIGTAISSLVNIFQFFSSEYQLKTFVIWSMGNLGGVRMNEIPYLLLFILGGISINVFMLKAMNVLMLGEMYAQSSGVNVRRMRVLIIISSSILTGTATAFCGPIAFIGIAVPHICRYLLKNTDSRIQLPANILVGAIFMLVADIISQLPSNQQILPINAITALFGAPVVIGVILHNYTSRENLS